jgi:hypothetical protein
VLRENAREMASFNKAEFLPLNPNFDRYCNHFACDVIALSPAAKKVLDSDARWR